MAVCFLYMDKWINGALDKVTCRADPNVPFLHLKTKMACFTCSACIKLTNSSISHSVPGTKQTHVEGQCIWAFRAGGRMAPCLSGTSLLCFTYLLNQPWTLLCDSLLYFKVLRGYTRCSNGIAFVQKLRPRSLLADPVRSLWHCAITGFGYPQLWHSCLLPYQKPKVSVFVNACVWLPACLYAWVCECVRAGMLMHICAHTHHPSMDTSHHYPGESHTCSFGWGMARTGGRPECADATVRKTSKLWRAFPFTSTAWVHLLKAMNT